MIGLFFSYVFCLFATGVAGGLVWALSLFSAPLWLQVIIGGAVAPIFAIAIVVYLGGFFNGWQYIFNRQDAEAKAVEESK